MNFLQLIDPLAISRDSFPRTEQKKTAPDNEQERFISTCVQLEEVLQTQLKAVHIAQSRVFIKCMIHKGTIHNTHSKLR